MCSSYPTRHNINNASVSGIPRCGQPKMLKALLGFNLANGKKNQEKGLLEDNATVDVELSGTASLRTEMWLANEHVPEGSSCHTALRETCVCLSRKSAITSNPGGKNTPWKGSSESAWIEVDHAVQHLVLFSVDFA